MTQQIVFVFTLLKRNIMSLTYNSMWQNQTQEREGRQNEMKNWFFPFFWPKLRFLLLFRSKLVFVLFCASHAWPKSNLFAVLLGINFNHELWRRNWKSWTVFTYTEHYFFQLWNSLAFLNSRHDKKMVGIVDIVCSIDKAWVSIFYVRYFRWLFT